MKASVVKSKYKELLQDIVITNQGQDLKLLQAQGIIQIIDNTLVWSKNSYQGIFNVYRQLFKLSILKIVDGRIEIEFLPDDYLEKLIAVKCVKDTKYAGNNYLGYLYNRYKHIIVSEVNDVDYRLKYIRDELTETDENGYVNWKRNNYKYDTIFIKYSEPFKMGFVKLDSNNRFRLMPL